MTRRRQQIHGEFHNVQGKISGALGSVQKEKDTATPGQGADLGHRLDDTGDIGAVGEGDEPGLRAERRRHVAGIQETVTVTGDLRDGNPAE